MNGPSIADQESNLWPVEEIPDADHVFYRVPVGWLKPAGTIHSGVFREVGGAMSVDWEKYCTAEESRARPGKPERFGILRMNVGFVRAIRDLSVKHEPVYQPSRTPPLVNRAHSGVHGIEPPPGNIELGYNERVRLLLLDRFHSWYISPEIVNSGQE